jgi:glycosyltransferase involved in cell wall biosynthesis
MALNHIRVSLLVPCFNAENYIQDFIENISQQIRSFDEVIFYDDASTDGTPKLLEQQNLGRVISGKINLGPSVGRNILLHASRGQLVHFHDIDDLLEPSFLACTLEALTEEVDVVITNMRVLDRDTGQTLYIHDYSELNQSENSTEFFLTHCCYAINGLYRKKELEKIGGFRESLSRDEDPDLHIRLAFAGARICSLPLPLAINRVGAGTYSSTSYVECWREHLKALRCYSHELPTKYRSVLCKDSARMVSLCAGGDLDLAYQYLEFCTSLGGQADLWQATSTPIKLLARLIGYRNALRLRFGRLGKTLRNLWPWRIG